MRFSTNIQKLQPSATIAMSTLAKKLTGEGRDIINLSAGEPDFDTPVWIVDRAVEGVRSGATRYTPAAGMPELRRAIAALLSARAGRTLDWSGVVVTAGAKQALFNACFTLFGPGDEILIAAPYWTSYPELITLARAEAVPVFGAESRDFKLTPEDLERAATARTRGLILNTPCNPTGAVYSMEELRAVAEWTRDRGVWLLADEIYHNIYHDDDRSAAPGLLDLPPDSVGPVVLVDGASKSYAMTGWRIGFSYSDPEVAARCAALQSHVTSNAATPSQVAALEAFSNREAAATSVSAMEAAFRRRRDLVTRLFDELLAGLPYVRPHGAFYLFFRVDSLFGPEVTSATAWCGRLLEEVGVALVPGAAFGDDRWVRMSYAASDDELERAIRRIAAFAAEGSPVAGS